MILKASARSKANKELYQKTKVYHKDIPIEDIFATLKSHGITVVDEANEEWQGMLLGRDSSAHFNISIEGQRVTNCMLFMSWYRMPSGNWEINCYLS